MAVRAFQRRLLSFLCPIHPPPTHPLKDPSWQYVPSASSFLRQYDFFKRAIQTQNEPIVPNVEDRREPNSVDTKANSFESDNVPSQIGISNLGAAVKYSTASNLKPSSRHDLAMIFTCRVCETRSVKTVCRESYEKGVVVARCGGCNNLHLIADHLGWFGEPGSVEDFLAARGEEVKKGDVDTLSLTLEDLSGRKP